VIFAADKRGRREIIFAIFVLNLCLSAQNFYESSLYRRVRQSGKSRDPRNRKTGVAKRRRSFGSRQGFRPKPRDLLQRKGFYSGAEGFPQRILGLELPAKLPRSEQCAELSRRRTRFGITAGGAQTSFC
jgi:hypothetical protein